MDPVAGAVVGIPEFHPCCGAADLDLGVAGAVYVERGCGGAGADADAAGIEQRLGVLAPDQRPAAGEPDQPDVVRPPSPLYRAQYAEGGITSLFNRLAGKPDSDGQFKFDPNKYQPYTVTPPDPYRAQYVEGGLAMGGVSNMPPQTNFANPSSYEQGTSQYSMATDPMSGNIANRMASGGIAQLAVGGKLLRGDGDGMSDSINANIAGSQQARLADGEFVIPADVVSHLGNGSTDAGAKHLYSMMDKVRQARVGTKKQGKQINPNKFIPV
jgi:hypothetical protein